MSEESGTELLQWLARAVRTGMHRGVMLLLWLVVFGAAATSESQSVGAALLVLGLVAFLLLHVVRRLPVGWDRGRLGPPPLSVLTTGVLVSLAVVAAEVLWVVYRNALDVEGPPDTFVFRTAVILAFPLIEEFGFRLWLQSPLERHLGGAGAVVAVALLYASFQGTALPLSPFLAACLYGAALLITGSIWTPVLLHTVQNAALIFLGDVPAVDEWATATAAASPGWLLPAVFAAWVVVAAIAFVWLRGLMRSTSAPAAPTPGSKPR